MKSNLLFFYFKNLIIFSTKKMRTSFSYKKRKNVNQKWKVISFFILYFFNKKMRTKFLLQKEKNVNQKWKVVSFFILYFFNEKISTNFSYKKRKMSIKNGKWFPFLFYIFQRKYEDKISLTKREKCQSKMESDLIFYF